MSGHSHFATIKRQKEAKDSQRGKVFSKHAKAIQIAIKGGGGADPELNSKLRFAIEQAKSDNVPKVNIDRILSRASEMGSMDEVLYEGFGPGGINILVEALTDNKNRTVQEIKGIFERGGGTMASPGAVSFNFEKKGLITVKKATDADSQMLSLMDISGIEDISSEEEDLEIYTLPSEISEIKDKITSMGYEATSFAIIQKSKNYQKIEDLDSAKKALAFIEKLEDHDDVSGVYTNLDIPEDLLSKLE